MREPPELGQPYGSDVDRADEIVRLIHFDVSLEQLHALSRKTYPEMHASPLWQLLVNAQLERGDTVEARLQRWGSLFAEELASVHEARNRVVYSIPISDRDLRTAVWLASELYRLTTGSGSAHPHAS